MTEPRNVDTLDFVSASEIADRLGCSVGAVHQVRRRRGDFPLPLVRLAIGPIWSWREVERWVTIHGWMR